MNKYNRAFIAFSYALFVIFVLRTTYVTGVRQGFNYLLIAALISVIFFRYGVRQKDLRTQKFKAPREGQFFTDFLKMTSEIDFFPSCQMENNYFFQQSYFGAKSLITLKRNSDTEWEMEYPASIESAVRDHLEAYKIMSELTDSPPSS